MNTKFYSIKNEKELLRYENQQFKIKIKKLEDKIVQLEKQTSKKHNERAAGRKQYEDKDIIKRIFQMYSQGKTYQQIADALNNEKIPTKAGGTWAKSSVRYIFYNESYVKKGMLSQKEYNLDFS